MSSNVCWFLFGCACGAGLMYFTDPQGGRRRRALARDKAVAWANDAQEYAENTARDLSNRAYGSMIEARKAVTGTVGSAAVRAAGGV
jgi:hypothetical protein